MNYDSDEECVCADGLFCDIHKRIINRDILGRYKVDPGYRALLKSHMGIDIDPDAIPFDDTALSKRPNQPPRPELTKQAKKPCGKPHNDCPERRRQLNKHKLLGFRLGDAIAAIAEPVGKLFGMSSKSAVEWAVVVTAAPLRGEHPLPHVLYSIEEAGWTPSEITVFAEPGVVVPERYHAIRNPRQLGCWENLLTAIKTALDNTTAGQILCVEHDTVIAPGTLEWIKDHPWPKGAGVINLYRNKGHRQKTGKRQSEWQNTNQICEPANGVYQRLKSPNWAWGSNAFIITREAAERLVKDMPKGGTPDNRIGKWSHAYGVPYYLVTQSRAQHLIHYGSSRGNRTTVKTHTAESYQWSYPGMSAIESKVDSSPATPIEKKTVHIIRWIDGWVLERIGDAWNPPGYVVTRDTVPNPYADINFYVNWVLYNKCNQQKSNCDIGYFTHREGGQKGQSWDRAAASLDHCVAMCQRTAEWLPRHKTSIIPTPIDAQFRSHKLVLGVCARQYPRKRFEWIDYLEKLGVEVRLTGGNVPFEKLPQWYRGIDYLVVLSEVEGGPMPVIEALAMGTPVIAPPTGWCWEYPVIRYDGTLKGLLGVVENILAARITEKQANQALGDLFNRLLMPQEKSSKVVVYTALFAGYDELIRPTIVNPHVRYVCFTDGSVKPCEPWELIKVDRTEPTPSLDNRRYKLLPHEYLPGYDWWIYFDANCQIRTDPEKIILFCQQSLGERELYACKHKGVGCVYDEAERIKQYAFSPASVVDAQMRGYEQERYPIRNGLSLNRFLVRRNTERIQALGELWWNEVSTKSHRDQLSLQYAVWKTGVNAGYLPWRDIDKVCNYMRHKKPHTLYGHPTRRTRHAG